MQQAFPKEVEASRLTLALERETEPLTRADFAIVDQIVQEIESLRDAHPDLKLGKVTSYRDGILGQRMTSADGCCTLIQVSLDTPIMAIGTQTTVDRTNNTINEKLGETVKDKQNNGLRLYFTGSAGIGRDMTRSAATASKQPRWPRSSWSLSSC